MDFVTVHQGREGEIEEVFRAAFAASEGEAEGALIAALARALMATTPPEDLRFIGLCDAGKLVGAAFLSRVAFARDPRRVFLLSPVAVLPEAQGRGVGQQMLWSGLQRLQAEGVDVVLTYGDPRYYGRVGFQPVTEARVPAPMPLSMPQGWLGQPLKGAEIAPFEGPSRCVPALAQGDLW